MSKIFRFKQFSVEQSGCAMKINTDGVLLGALAGEGQPHTILDIGTGTGVIALMLAQRFGDAQIDAVEIDESAAKTARLNALKSPFNNRVSVYNQSFIEFFDKNPDAKYELIVSNPPFYTASLLSPDDKKSQAKHADAIFFDELTKYVSRHLSPAGQCWLILPLNTSALVKEIAANSRLYIQSVIKIGSFKHSEPHREILVLGSEVVDIRVNNFVIYNDVKVYSERYTNILKDFFTIF